VTRRPFPPTVSVRPPPYPPVRERNGRSGTVPVPRCVPGTDGNGEQTRDRDDAGSAPHPSTPLPGTSDVLADLALVVGELGADEARTLLVLARRLLAGQRTYGRLDLAHDGRSWRRERAEELADALVYGAIAEVASTLGRGAP